MSTPDEFHYHEVLDRISIINDNIANFLIDHPLMEHEHGLRDLIIEGVAKLHQAYTACGLIKFEKFPDVPAYPATPEEVIAFVGSHFDSMEQNVDLSNVRFQLTVHDLLSAFEWWQE